MRHTAAGYGIAGFLLAQAFALTEPAALPVLAIGGLWATLGDELDLARRIDAVEWSLAALVAAWLASAFAGSHPVASLSLSVPLLAFVLIVVMLRRSVSFDADLSLVLAALASLAALAWMRVAIAVIDGDDVSTRPWIVVPNDVCWVAVALPWFVQRYGKRRAFAGLIVLAAFALALFAQSRLALVVIAVSLVASSSSTRRARIAVAAVAIAAVAIAVAWLAKGAASLGARGELATAALKLGAESPLFGVGPHRFAAHYLDVVDVGALTDPRLTPWPHSLPLELWAETGLAGLMAVAALIYSARRCGRSQSWGDYESATRGVIGGFIVAVAFEASTLRVWTWVIAAVLVAMVARGSTDAARDG